MKSDKTANKIQGNQMPESFLPYGVGALLYAPATNGKIVRLITEQKLDERYSASLCLEDSISDSSVGRAEEQIIKDFSCIAQALERDPGMYLPQLFIRVRAPGQIPQLFSRLGGRAELLTGFIIPKYAPASAERYNESIAAVNERASRRVYMMPTLESRDIVCIPGRAEALGKLREQIDQVSEFILNVRVGGNDFCNAFGVRRGVDETIYDCLAVSRILSDIITVFVPDYVVSGPVWEYFSGEDENWKQGLLRELKLDKLNGFTGKTVIHPSQISVVNQSLRVSRSDVEDARRILGWSPENADMVEKNCSGERMNEVKVHTKWAEKTVILSEIYGIKETDAEE